MKNNFFFTGRKKEKELEIQTFSMIQIEENGNDVGVVPVQLMAKVTRWCPTAIGARTTNRQ